MKTRLKGGGGLSRKLLTMLAVAVMPMSGLAVAQSASTSPNLVYIEQIGNSNTVTIDQTGGSNAVGGTASATPSSTNYGTITGSSNTLAMIQTGDANLGQYNIRGNNNVYTSTVIGNTNSTKLSIGDITNATNLRNTVTETITGNANIVDQTLIGNDIVSTLSITGNTNEVTTELKSTNGSSIITIVGGNNKLDAQQLDVAGANGHTLAQTVTGDYNSITTQQQGTIDTAVNIQTTGDHNTITVRSSNSAIVGARTAIAR